MTELLKRFSNNFLGTNGKQSNNKIVEQLLINYIRQPNNKNKQNIAALALFDLLAKKNRNESLLIANNVLKNYSKLVPDAKNRWIMSSELNKKTRDARLNANHINPFLLKHFDLKNGKYVRRNAPIENIENIIKRLDNQYAKQVIQSTIFLQSEKNEKNREKQKIQKNLNSLKKETLSFFKKTNIKEKENKINKINEEISRIKRNIETRQANEGANRKPQYNEYKKYFTNNRNGKQTNELWKKLNQRIQQVKRHVDMPSKSRTSNYSQYLVEAEQLLRSTKSDKTAIAELLKKHFIIRGEIPSNISQLYSQHNNNKSPIQTYHIKYAPNLEKIRTNAKKYKNKIKKLQNSTITRQNETELKKLLNQPNFQALNDISRKHSNREKQ